MCKLENVNSLWYKKFWLNGIYHPGSCLLKTDLAYILFL